MRRPQFFGIGWPKSGTNSLTKAFQCLGLHTLHTGGYRYHHPHAPQPDQIVANVKNGADDPFENLADWIEQFDAALDWPMHIAWRKLLECDPNSKFIVTYDTPQTIAWSCIRHDWRNRVQNNAAAFSTNYEALIKQITAHYDAVFAAALEHPQRFILLAQTDSCAHKWRALCALTKSDCDSVKIAGNFPPWPREFRHEDEIFLPPKPDKVIEACSSSPLPDIAPTAAPKKTLSLKSQPSPPAASFLFGDQRRAVFGPSSAADNFAVITCHWNPANWQSIRRNYQRFLHEMDWWGAPVFSAEIAYEGQTWASEATTFKISGTDANLVWQKERLLNYIVERLPEKYTKIAWIDADAIFLDPFWIEKTKTVLDEYPLVQLWHKWYSAGQHGELVDALISVGHMGRRYKAKQSWSPGGAWAGVRDLFPIYDRHVVGSGDALCLEGWLGANYAQTQHCMTDAMRRHFESWALAAHAKTNGRVTTMLFDALHLYHGARKNRHYYERSQQITAAEFDPAKHVCVDENGLLAWTAAAPASLVQQSREYFTSRLEDDAEIPSTANLLTRK